MSDAPQRSVPYHCPYCAGEDLWPHEPQQHPAGGPVVSNAWECRECTRVFAVTFLGMVV